MSTIPENRVVFDVETQRTFDEVGGYEFRDKLGISYVGVYSYSQETFYGFEEKDMGNLEKILLEEKPMLIGFNSISFDNAVMQPYFDTLDLSTLPHLDMLREVEQELGHRLKLDSIAQTTLHAGKSGDGLDAVRWYREGNIEALAKYCMDDVAITRDVYEFGKRHGSLYYMTGGNKTAVPASWSSELTIPALLQDAFKRHMQAHIEYMEPVEGADGPLYTERTVEILDYDSETGFFEAYCQVDHEKRRFDVSNVWSATVTENPFAHQANMFG